MNAQAQGLLRKPLLVGLPGALVRHEVLFQPAAQATERLRALFGSDGRAHGIVRHARERVVGIVERVERVGALAVDVGNLGAQSLVRQDVERIEVVAAEHAGKAHGVEDALVGARRRAGGQRDAYAAARHVGEAQQRIAQIGGRDGARGERHIYHARAHAEAGPIVGPAHLLGEHRAHALAVERFPQLAEHALREIGGHHLVAPFAQRHRQRACAAAHVEHRLALADAG